LAGVGFGDRCLTGGVDIGHLFAQSLCDFKLSS
jgi:hypothetical protein